MPTQTEIEQAVEHATKAFQKANAVGATASVNPFFLKTILTALSDAQESAHYATGVADLAMKHRDVAEKQLTDATAAVEKLTEQLLEARKDSERLDILAEWVLEQRRQQWYVYDFHGPVICGPTLREAIDDTVDRDYKIQSLRQSNDSIPPDDSAQNKK